jgi:predicted alpha/beta superfamily hydrolase
LRLFAFVLAKILNSYFTVNPLQKKIPFVMVHIAHRTLSDFRAQFLGSLNSFYFSSSLLFTSLFSLSLLSTAFFFVALCLTVLCAPMQSVFAQDVITFSIDMRTAISQRWLEPDKDLFGVRGSIAPLRWDSTLIATDPDGDGIYTLTVNLKPSGKYEKIFGVRKLAYKFKVENNTKLNGGWENVPNSVVQLTGKPQTVSRAFNVHAAPPLAGTRLPNVRLHPYYQPRTLLQRTISVYLPPDYEKSSQRYPVLYMHDGQNLFDDSTSASGEWYADEIADMLIRKKKLPPIIIVGVSVRGEDRINEYTPVPTRRFDGLGRPEDIGGKGYLHAQMLVEEIKPLIDSLYRTLPDRQNTAVGGSSLGGLMTMYCGLTYPNVFGRLMVMSPSVWWSKNWIVAAIQQNVHDTIPESPKPSSMRIWLDVGDAEGAETIQGVRELKNTLLEKGWKLGSTLSYTEAKKAPHSEAAWAERLEPALLFLFGRQGRR